MDTISLLFGIAVCALSCAIILAFEGGGRMIPKPPEHLRPKGSVPRMKNPPPPPKKNNLPKFKNPPPPPPPLPKQKVY